MDKPKESKLIVRLNAETHEWFKVYAQRINMTMSALIKGHIESLRIEDSTEAVEPSSVKTKTKPTQAEIEIAHLKQLQQQLIEQRDDLRQQIALFDSQLARRDEQTESLTRSLDQSQQLLAISQKSIQQLTAQNHLLIADQKRPSWWQRVFARSAQSEGEVRGEVA
jgi:septal ring factor EnvC (AmiA/AmiB activator)